MKEIFDDFLKDCKRRKLRGLDIVQFHLKPVRAWFEKMPADQITALDVKRYKEHRQAQGRAVATVNRELQYLGQALRLAQANDLIAKVPKIRKDAEQNARQGFFRQGDVARLLAALPDDLRDFVLFGYLTGWRKGEIAKLEWTHLEGRVLRLPPEISKTKDGRVLVLAGELATLIERRRVAQIDGIPWVFHRVVQGKPGTPIKEFYRSWDTALKKAGIPDDRIFHDFRRTAIRNMHRAKVPRQTAKKISGHKTDAIYNRYDIVDEDDIEAGVLLTQQYLDGDNTVTVTLDELSAEKALSNASS
jgi:integrase